MSHPPIPDDERNAAVGVYPTHDAAEAAVKTLQGAGIDMTKLSIVGRGYHTEDEVVGYYTAGDRMKKWGKLGAFWGGLWGFLVGSAFFAIPGIGPLVFAGPIVSWMVGALEGAAIGGGIGVLGGALGSVGIPKDATVNYETALKADQFLLVLHGTRADVAKAKEAMATTGPEHLAAHYGE